jgi:hypothetical protein
MQILTRKEWKGCAAMAPATSTEDLLCLIALNRWETEKIGDVLSSS